MSSDKPASDDSDWQAAAYEQFLRDDSDADLVYEEAWATEVERRETAIESGDARFIPGPEALAKLEDEFNE